MLAIFFLCVKVIKKLDDLHHYYLLEAKHSLHQYYSRSQLKGFAKCGAKSTGSFLSMALSTSNTF